MAAMSNIKTGLVMDFAESHDENDQDNSIIDADDEDSDASSNADEDLEFYNPQTGEGSQKRTRSATLIREESVMHTRTAGTSKHGTAMKAKADRADDERIYELKKQGYAGAAIANKLREERRCDLQPSTVDNRYKRVRERKEKEEEERLDDELSDWHVGEDDELRESLNAVEKKVEIRIQKLQEQKWKEVSDHLAQSRQGRTKKYTGKACKERLEGLLDGTALKPIELDSDQEGRAKMRETRIVEARQARVDAAEAARLAKEEMALKSRESQDYKVRKRQQAAETKQAKEEDKAENLRIRDEKNIGKAKEREAKEAALERARKEAQDKKQTRDAEERVYRYYTGKVLNRDHARDRKKKEGNEEEEYDDWADSEDDAEDRYELIDVRDGDEDAASLDGDKLSTGPIGKERQPKTISRPGRVTKETLLNPRSILTDSELQVILFTRGLDRRGVRETHPQVVARLAAADTALGASELTDLLNEKLVSTKGNAEVRIHRLQEAEALASAAGQEGIKWTDLEFKKGYEGYIGEWARFIDED